MTTYTAIAAGELDADSPITDTLMARLDANPRAMFEGAAGAPRLEYAALSAWYITPGGLGTPVFAKRTSTTAVAFGGMAAGSTLRPASAAVAFTVSGTPASATFTSASVLSGTWQCLGNYDGAPALANATMDGATLWQRIS